MMLSAALPPSGQRGPAGVAGGEGGRQRRGCGCCCPAGGRRAGRQQGQGQGPSRQRRRGREREEGARMASAARRRVPAGRLPLPASLRDALQPGGGAHVGPLSEEMPGQQASECGVCTLCSDYLFLVVVSTPRESIRMSRVGSEALGSPSLIVASGFGLSFDAARGPRPAPFDCRQARQANVFRPNQV